LYFISRRDEMIKTSGYRVSPTEVEEVVYATGLVGEAAALGIAHPVLGQAIVVVATDPANGRLDTDALLVQCRQRLPAFMVPSRIHLHYAIKANPMPEVVRHVAGLVDGLDVASAGELKVALGAGMSAASISFAGPGKTDMELGQAVAAGIVVNLESEREMERLAAIGTRKGARPRVAVRVNPDFELKSSGMKMGGGPQQFGVDAERVPAMLERLGRLKLDF